MIVTRFYEHRKEQLNVTNDSSRKTERFDLKLLFLEDIMIFLRYK